MNEHEAEMCWNKLRQLWPSWKHTNALYKAWLLRFSQLNYKSALIAIDEHWEEHAKAFQPDPAAVVKLANRLTFDADTPEQTRKREWFYGLNKLMQARALREHYDRMAKKSEGEQRHRYESLEVIAAAQAARLYILHGEHCPPNFGANTSRGAAPGTLFAKVTTKELLESK